MPHLRPRDALPLLKKKLSFSPVVSIQGARQTGKSTLARDVLKDQYYLTLDRPALLNQAKTSTEVFLEEARSQADGKLVVIDEAQKAPPLFDLIKYFVDRDKKPGQFLLLGSTEFSKEVLIRESLTGRLSRLRLFPMTCGETLQKGFRELDRNGLFPGKARVSRSEFVKFLGHGGYPGIFAVRDPVERTQRWDDLVTLTCERDALLFPKMKGDSDLCRRILALSATLEEPTQAEFSAALRVSAKKIATQIKILSQLFMLHAIRPHPLGTGKIRYYLNDAGLAAFLGASFERRLETAAYLEQFARRAYSVRGCPELFYYRTTKGSVIHLLTQESPTVIHAQKIIHGEKSDQREFEVLIALGKKAEKQGIKAHLSALAATEGTLAREKIKINLWETLG